MENPNWADMGRQLTIPGGLLSICAFCCWRAWGWIKPRAERVIEAHVSLVESLKKHQEEQVELNRKTVRTMRRLARTMSCGVPVGGNAAPTPTPAPNHK